MPRLALFRRLPQLRWLPRANEPFIPLNEQAQYTALAEDFATLDRELMPHFWRLDQAALEAQNRFRLEQLTLIVGGMVAAALGALQTALVNLAWPGILEALLATVIASLAQRSRVLNAHKHYFTNRLKAELLRSEYFLFLGRIGAYADEVERARRLRVRVAEIIAGQASHART